MRFHLAALLFATTFTACSDAPTGAGDAEPTLEITSPDRGTTSDGTQVTVTGHVADDSPGVKLTINGQAVVPAADGSFSALVDVTPGMSLIETHAIDSTGHDVRDIRAVLAGTLSPSDGSVSSQIAARAGADTLTAVGNVIAGQASTIDFDAIAKQQNPVYNNGGCLGAKVDITSVSLGAITAALAPITDRLSTDVEIANIVVKAHADYKVACIGGGATITVKSTKARIHGELGVAVNSMNVRTSLPTATVALDGFSLDVGGIPSAVENLFKAQIRTAVENALVDAIKSKVPGFADSALAGLVAKPLSTNLLGHDLAFGITPAQVDLSPDGLFIALDTKVTVAGGEGGMFVATSADATPALMAGSTDLGVALANDAINQLFAGLWATGAMDQELDISTVGPLAALLDDDTKTLSVHFSLPPSVTTDGEALGLAIGDLIITGKDAAGADVQKMAITLTTALSAAPTQAGKLALTTGTPVVKAQMLFQSEVVDRPLTGQQIEGIVSGAWGLVGSMADSALAKVPMPQISGVSFGAPRIVSRNSFVVADIAVH
ncbi:MAG: hypothetical protein NT062_10815 [Proteobacteria bacterium]|nr:hypothetical protein [Pseudomonadota bacterium]